MVEVRFLSVNRLIRRGTPRREKGNTAEICVLPKNMYWVAKEYFADCHLCEALRSLAVFNVYAFNYGGHIRFCLVLSKKLNSNIFIKVVHTMKKVVSILMAAVLTAGLCSCGKSSKSNNTLKVGMECGYAPFNWTQSDDSNDAVKISGSSDYAGGYDIQIAKKIAQNMGKELEIVKTDWEGLLPALTSGKIDVIIAGMSATAERKESIDFSDNYYTSDLVVVVKKDGPYADAKTINDFSGAKLTAQLNTFHYSVLDQMTGIDKQTALEDFPTMTVALSSGKIDGYISERPGALSAVATNPDLTFVEFSDEGNFEYDEDEVSIAVGVIKGSELTEKINEALSSISEKERETIMKEAINNQPTVE